MSQSCSNGCFKASTLIFACSGAADVGEVSDQAARQLARQGAGKMYCLAGLGGNIPAYIKTTEAAGKVLAIDGCPTDCAKHVLERAGISNFEHLRLADLGLVKGSSPATVENVCKVVARGIAFL